MKLWHIERDYYGYEEWDAFIIRARTEQEARDIACAYDGTCDSPSFNSPKHSKCTEIKIEGEPGVILDSFNAG